MSQSQSSLSRNTTLMAIGTLLSRITGFGRIFALGYAIGLTGLGNTYSVANGVPNIVFELVVGGILAATVVPIFVRSFKERDEKDAWHAVNVILTTTMVLVIAMAALTFLLAPWIIDLYTLGDEHQAEERAVGTFLLRLFAPQIAIYGFISVATGLLNARRIFAPPMFAPICNNLVVIFVLLSVPSLISNRSLEAVQHDTSGLLFLGLGTTAGVVAMGLVLVPYLRRTSEHQLHFAWDLKHPALRTVVRMSSWTVGFIAANQVSWWVMTVLASRNDGFGIFNAAYQFFVLPHGIFAVSVMTALQPELAAQWADQRLDGFRQQFANGLRLISFVMVPAAVGYALLAVPIVTVVLQHGSTTAADADLTGKTLAAMAIGLPGFSAFLFFARAFQAMQDARTVFWLYVVENVLNIATAIAFFPAMGVWGLGLSQSVAYLATAFVAFLVLRRRSDGLHGRILADALARMVAAVAVMALVIVGVTVVMGDHLVMRCIAAILAGAMTYLAATKLFGLSDLNAFLGRFRRRTA